MSFKNTKSIFRRNDAKRTPFIATKPERKEWMVKSARLIASQLRSAFATSGVETTPECWKRFVTFSLPPDDCWMDMEIGSVKTILVPKGEEGADIVIERIVPEIPPAEAVRVYGEKYAEVLKENV